MFSSKMMRDIPAESLQEKPDDVKEEKENIEGRDECEECEEKTKGEDEVKQTEEASADAETIVSQIATMEIKLKQEPLETCQIKLVECVKPATIILLKEEEKPIEHEPELTTEEEKSIDSDPVLTKEEQPIVHEPEVNETETEEKSEEEPIDTSPNKTVERTE